MKAVSTFCVVRFVEWSKRFLEGRELLEGDASPGQTHRVITPEMIADVNSSVLDNHRITCTRSIRYWVFACHLNFRKYCAQWVPHQLTVLSLSHLQRYHEEEYSCLWQMVTGDGTWSHHFEPEIKRQSKQWKLAISPSPKKSKRPCIPILVKS
ncbi:histone-lysine N-methyltransferase SETMAR [Trichonephila clavata]|uniref:Histone-lysine N-methyltransferase SETMAR n=1 Tax=Trichonephila clavata TaxID=2740835 RepID=A0A8X6LFW3_TRICU|nr:histone-lysine N-methyltransferase SETMAR [Trichonephila clavata]